MQVIPVSFNSPEFLDIALSEDSFYQPKRKEEILYELSPERHFFKHGFGQAFACIQNSKTVGRIYVSIDHLIQSTEKIGVFGYFDSIDNFEVSKLLFKAAEEWLKKEGCVEMHGPVNLNIYNGYRLQTDGFETAPFLGEPRNFSYYPKLLESAGLQKIAGWRSWDFSIIWLPLFVLGVEWKIFKLNRQKKLKDFKATPFNKQKIEEEFTKLYPLIMDSFKKNYLFTPVDLEEYKSYFLGLSQLLDATSAIVFDKNNDVAGFSFTYPQEKSLVLHTLCISEKYQRGGLVYLLNQFTNRGVLGRYTRFIGALAKDGRTLYDKMGPASRSYAVFKKKI